MGARCSSGLRGKARHPPAAGLSGRTDKAATAGGRGASIDCYTQNFGFVRGISAPLVVLNYSSRMWKSYLFAATAAAVLSGPCLGGDFVTGQAARAVIGQPFFNAQNAGAASTTPAPAGGPRRPRRPANLQGTPITLLGAASGVAYVNNTLFVVDDNHLGFTPDNNRVLIYPEHQSDGPGGYGGDSATERALPGMRRRGNGSCGAARLR